jgi:hypothetical protein
MAETSLEEIITRENGDKYVKTFRDTNDIHTKGDIVQAMQLAALTLKSLDSLFFPLYNIHLKSLEIEPKMVTRYGEPLYFQPPSSRINPRDVITTYGKKKVDESICLEVKAVYDSELDIKKSAIREEDLLQKQQGEKTVYSINASKEDYESFCDSINLPPQHAGSEHLKRFFLASFVAGALCNYINPNDIQGNRIPLWAKQTFLFYKFPDSDSSIVDIFLEPLKNSERIARIKERFCIDDYEVIEGDSILIKEDRKKFMEFLENA